MIRTCMSEVDTHDLSHSYSSAYSSVTKCCLAITRDNNRKKKAFFIHARHGRESTDSTRKTISSNYSSENRFLLSDDTFSSKSTRGLKT